VVSLELMTQVVITHLPTDHYYY